MCGVAGLLELEGRVLDADGEVAGNAGLQVVEEPGEVAVVEALVVDDDVSGEDGQAGGDLAGVQVVDGLDVRNVEDVAADVVEVEARRAWIRAAPGRCRGAG